MSWFKLKRQTPRVPLDAVRAQDKARIERAQALERAGEVDRVVGSLRALHKENHLAEAIISSMTPRFRMRRPWRHES